MYQGYPDKYCFLTSLIFSTLDSFYTIVFLLLFFQKQNKQTKNVRYFISQKNYEWPYSCWTRIFPAFANSVDPEQLASEEAKWPGSALFAIQYVT